MNTVSQMRAIGYEVQLEDQDIVCRWRGPGQPEPRRVRPLISQLREYKSEAVEWLRNAGDLPAAVSDWPEARSASYEERAAIMQHDGGLTRLLAEYRAEEIVRETYRR